MKKVLIAMSGGVDSSVAAYLLKEQGYDCTGATMRLYDGACDAQSVSDAQNVCSVLGIPHLVFDLSEEFDKHVISRFVDAYKAGATPNPCVDCNRSIKFGALFDKAMQLGMDYVATGHYARVERDGQGGRCFLKKARDASKDQSYVLYSLTQEHLAHVLFPLGGLTKNGIRSMAARQGFLNADKPDSQDICFVPDGDYAGFIERHTGQQSGGGDFLDMQGNVLGRHKGLIRYTIGQRKGLGLAVLNPMYVYSKDAAANTITLCEADGLFSSSLDAGDFNWISGDAPHGSIRVKAKTRYKAAEAAATATPGPGSTAHIEFDKPQRAITNGQAVVLYDGDTVLGGGTII